MNIMRFKYMKICKEFNLNVSKSMRFIDIENILNKYFIEKNFFIYLFIYLFISIGTTRRMP